MQVQHPSYLTSESEAAYRKQVEQAWKDFVATGDCQPGSVRDVIRSSWQRCRSRGVECTQHYPPLVASGEQLQALRTNNQELLLACANTWDMLVDFFSDTEGVFTVAAANGVLLDVRNSPSLNEDLLAQRIAPGYDWSENRSGTNAVGTAVATKQAVQVYGSEHFCETVKVWNCSAAPIIDNIDGDLLGVIDVTTLSESYSAKSLALAVTAAQQIEQTMQSRELARNVRLVDWFTGVVARWPRDGLVLLDRKGRVVTVNDQARALFEAQDIDHLLSRTYRLVRAEDLSSIQDWQGLLPQGILPVAYEAYNRDGHTEGGVLVVRAASAAPVLSCMASADTAPNVDCVDTGRGFDEIVTGSEVMNALCRRAERMAASSASVLIQGETGTGKELFARAIHRADRGDSSPFVAVNCGALGPEFAVSELLGQEAGDRVGAPGQCGKLEQADGGTLFLDEVGELPLHVQVMLLRVLEDGIVVRLGGAEKRRVDVRLIAATNRELEVEVEAGRFRRDLFHRIKTLQLDLVPLRERDGDIALLTDYFLSGLAEQYRHGDRQLSADAQAAFEAYAWPGNVRELRGVLESMYLLVDDRVLGVSSLPAPLRRTWDERLGNSLPPEYNTASPDTLESMEKARILRELDHQGGNRSRVARQLGISRSTLYRKLRGYGIEP